MRSCGPAWRCTAARIAAGGTSNSTLATVIGSAGALSGIGPLGQVGHSTKETKIPAPITMSAVKANGSISNAARSPDRASGEGVCRHAFMAAASNLASDYGSGPLTFP